MSRGRKPVHGSNAERQRAYRQRKSTVDKAVEIMMRPAKPVPSVEQAPLNFVTHEAPRTERREIVTTPRSGPAVQPGGNVVAVVEPLPQPLPSEERGDGTGGIEPGTVCRHELATGLEVRVERALERARVEATVMRAGVSSLQQGWRYPFKLVYLSEVSG